MKSESRFPHALVLLVDDDPRAARMLAQLLREDGCDVVLAPDGPSAIARLARTPSPDVLMTDVNVATIDGLTVARYARSRRPTMPIFILTGYPELVRAPDLAGPAPIVFTKPVQYRELASALARALGEAACVT